MAKRASVLTVLVWLLGVGVTAQAPAPPPIRNFLRHNDQFCTGGQPRVEHFAQLKADGVKAVINLRTPGEHRAAEEEAAVKELGMLLQHPRRLQQPHRRTGHRIPASHRRPGQPPGLHPLHRGDSCGRILDDPPRAARRLHDRGCRERGRNGGTAREPAPEPVRPRLHRQGNGRPLRLCFYPPSPAGRRKRIRSA